MNVANDLEGKCNIVEEFEGKSLEIAWDDVSGADLDLKQVKKARAEELEYVLNMKLYDKVPVAECYQKTGKSPIKAPNYRSRLVAREINTHKRGDFEERVFTSQDHKADLGKRIQGIKLINESFRKVKDITFPSIKS